MRRTGLLAALVMTAIAVVGVGSAASAPQALSYSRMSATAVFSYKIEYGSHPDSTFNGTYVSFLTYHLNTIAVYDGRRVWSLGGQMLADGGRHIAMNMTEWRGAPPTPRRRITCSQRPTSSGSTGLQYKSDTDGGRFSGGGGIGVSNAGLTVNPGRAIKWSIGCSATESLETHGLPGGPTFSVPAPRKSLFTQRKAFSIGCDDSYSHPWEPGEGAPSAHKFTGQVFFNVRFTPFPASQLTATKKRLRDRVGRNLPTTDVKSLRDCP